MAYRFWDALRLLRAQKCARSISGPAAALALTVCAGLSGCVSDPAGWPDLGKVSDLDHVMTPEQRDKMLKDLQKSDQDQSGAASGAQAKRSQ